MVDATVIGASGFVGAALVRRLRADGIDVAAIGRGESLPSGLGDVFFCAGLTADFRSRSHDTIDAHVCAVNQILKRRDLSSLTYLSSTRVYQRSLSGAEDATIPVDPRDPSDLYNLSKLTGEAICLADPRSSIRAVRLSNVFAARDRSENFLNSVVREALHRNEVTILAGRSAAKDYISLRDAVDAIARMPICATSRLINIASGHQISNEVIGALVEKHLGAVVHYSEKDTGSIFPTVEVSRMREELAIRPAAFVDSFIDYVAELRQS